MVLEYINIILESVGLPTILTVEELVTFFASCQEWWHALNPQALFSVFVILAFSYGMFFITCIMPFRLFKKLCKMDGKRGK